MSMPTEKQQIEKAEREDGKAKESGKHEIRLCSRNGEVPEHNVHDPEKQDQDELSRLLGLKWEVDIESVNALSESIEE